MSDFRQPADPDLCPAEPLGPVLRRILRRTGLAHANDRQKVWAAWQDLLGPDAAHTHLEGLRKGTATFVVDSSALLSELSNFRRQALLEGLQARVPSPFVSNLKFRLEKRA